MKKSIGIILLAAIILTGCQKNEISQQIEETPKVLDQTLQSGETSNINEKFLNPPEIEIASWETYFSYDCPNGWTKAENLNYNGRVQSSECSKLSETKDKTNNVFSFDDGISIVFNYVPQDVANGVKTAGEKHADIVLYNVQSELNVQPYINNNFIGRISLKNERHTLSLIARQEIKNGYYEVIAYGVGDTHSDQQYKKMVDDIVSTFTPKY